MLTTSDVVIAVLIALVIRDIVTVGLGWLAHTLTSRRMLKELDELLEDIEVQQARLKHPAGKKRAVKKAVKKK